LAYVLITGGAGNLGTALTRKLLDEGHRVRIFDLPQADFSLPLSWGAEIIKGNILDRAVLGGAVQGIDWIYHLAALLPPGSEKDRDRTLQVNVQGTKNLLQAMRASTPKPSFIFSSSVSIYGDTSGESPPVAVEHPPAASDFYSESKILCEEAVAGELENFTILRITGIAIPAFMDPPEIWQFQPGQRIEMICLSDLVTALARVPEAKEARGKTFNIAGGKDWRMRGQDFVKAFCGALEVPFENQKFQTAPGWFDWYDTEESQQILRYQETSFGSFQKQLRRAFQDAMA